MLLFISSLGVGMLANLLVYLLADRKPHYILIVLTIFISVIPLAFDADNLKKSTIKEENSIKIIDKGIKTTGDEKTTGYSQKKSGEKDPEIQKPMGADESRKKLHIDVINNISGNFPKDISTDRPNGMARSAN